MNYFKGLVSNVRGFYSEINSATLTGAIDVVVIRQEDGTFCGSPFHVRFGKLGVLRSREKIVDIQINGEPVDLQMKLGEAGEAFFVEEVEESTEVPTELCTSPIPTSLNLDLTISEIKEENAGREGECENLTEEEGEKTPTPFELSEKTEDKFDDTLVREDDKSEESHENKVSSSDLTTDTKELEKLVENTMDKEKDKKETSKDTKSESVENDDTKDNSADFDSGKLSAELKENSSTKESGVNESEVKEMEVNGSEANRSEKKISVCSEDSLDQSIEDNKDFSLKIDIPDTYVQDDDMYDTTPKEEDSSHSLSHSIPIPGRIAHNHYADQWMSDNEVSLLKDERFRIDHLYPLSDLDSPIGSPPNDSDIGSTTKPFNPDIHFLSDTEAEIQQSQDNMNMIEQVTWDWGKLPQGPEGVYKQERNLNSLKREEGNHGYRSKRLVHSKSHKIKEEGIYLDDLTTIDQEVAALYLNQALSKDARKTLSVESPTTEDRESGIGQSLPSSPTSELTGTGTSTGSETYSNLAMSLCGDLKSGKVALESFISNKVTFEDLSSNPALLSDPKLVIRINDRYYNWQIAAPMLMSYLIFQRPLRQDTVAALTKQYMPKKEKKRGYYWFSWRQNEESSDDDDFDHTKEKFRSRVHSGSRKQHTTTPTQQINKEEPTISKAEAKGSENDTKEDNETKEENEGKGKNEEMNDQELMGPQTRVRNMSECTSGNESDVGYRKTTRLTSEQLAKLNLHNGANSIHFSVTTKYQGTAECQATIYLWNYDDRIVISDIDGTITKSDVLGQILPVVGQAWAQFGVAQFFTSIERNGYKILYLSARAIGQAQITRDYLKSVKQDQITLPDGPLLLSPASLIKAFHREVIEKKPEEFKIAALRDIMGLFPTNKKPFYSGFGNKINDVYSYRAVGVSVSRIFTINHRGEVTNELTKTFQSSYLDLRQLVDQMFPPYKKETSKSSGLIASDEFSSFTYWRNPLPDVNVDEVVEDVYEDEDIPVTFTG